MERECSLGLRAMLNNAGRTSSSIFELDVPVEGPCTVVVVHEIVTVQAVTILVKVVGALRSLEAADGQDRGADRVGRRAAGVCDGLGQHVYGIERPRREI